MKLWLSVKITIKDFFPKNKNISYENYICIFSHHNFNGKINLGNLPNNNYIKNKTEIFNSNVVYNIHIYDIKKNSLIGIHQLIIYFDKIKNLNINDMLTQEETAKIIIDSKAKRKTYDKNNNISDIYLKLLAEIKIIDKKYETEDKNIQNNKEEKDNNNNNDRKLHGHCLSEFNLTPITIKKNKKIKSKIKEIDKNKKLDTSSKYDDELNLFEYSSNKNIKNKTPKQKIKKNKSQTKFSKVIINKNYKYNDFYNRQQSISSRTEMVSPSHNKTNYYFHNQKEENKADIVNQNENKKEIPKKKLTILNFMEEKNSLIYKLIEEDYLDLNNKSKFFKNTFINFNKNQINKNNNSHLRKNSSILLNTNHSTCSLRSKEKIKHKHIIKNNSRIFDENDYFQRKIKHNHEKNKIYVNITGKSNAERSFSSFKNKREINKKKSTKKLSLKEIGKFKTDNTYMKLNKKKIIPRKSSNNIKLSLQTEKKINIKEKIIKNKNVLTESDFEYYITEKKDYTKGNFQRYSLKEKNRGTFSPKLLLKNKYRENSYIQNDSSQDKFNYNKYKQKTYKKISTPKSKKKINSFSSKLYNEDKLLSEKKEIKSKLINLIDFYHLFSHKVKKISKKNDELRKKFKIVKEKCNYAIRQKHIIIQKINNNESKKIKNNVIFHFEEQQNLNKIIKIKLKENSIYKNIFGKNFGEKEMNNRILQLMYNKKKMMLDLIKNIVKFYGNITQIYNDDINKKNTLKLLLNKYNIKEKMEIDLNYISYIHKKNNFEDKIITEVDEDKENEEDEEEINIRQENNRNSNGLHNIKPKIIIDNINNMKDNDKENINLNININNMVKDIKKNNNSRINDNINNLIKKMIIEFPEKLHQNLKFINKVDNKYSLGNKIFSDDIENNGIIIKEENDKNKKLALNELYHKYCIQEKKGSKINLVYTKKLRQKYIKMQNYDKELSIERKTKNENSTTMSENIHSFCGKLNDIGDIKNSMSEENKSF